MGADRTRRCSSTHPPPCHRTLTSPGQLVSSPPGAVKAWSRTWTSSPSNSSWTRWLKDTLGVGTNLRHPRMTPTLFQCWCDRMAWTSCRRDFLIWGLVSDPTSSNWCSSNSSYSSSSSPSSSKCRWIRRSNESTSSRSLVITSWIKVSMVNSSSNVTNNRSRQPTHSPSRPAHPNSSYRTRVRRQVSASLRCPKA